MSEQDPAIIQGDHPFKVEAVLSKTGGVNALAKRPKKMNQGQEIQPPHHTIVPAESVQAANRVRLDANLIDNEMPQDPGAEDQIHSPHQEHFTDPSRRLTTNHRVEIQPSEGDGEVSLVGPTEDTSLLAAASVELLKDGRDEKNASTQASAEVTNSQVDAEPEAIAESEPAPQEQRLQFLRRIEQIKNNNESVGKDLEALEKLSGSRPPLNPAD